MEPCGRCIERPSAGGLSRGAYRPLYGRFHSAVPEVSPLMLLRWTCGARWSRCGAAVSNKRGMGSSGTRSQEQRGNLSSRRLDASAASKHGQAAAARMPAVARQWHDARWAGRERRATAQDAHRISTAPQCLWSRDRERCKSMPSSDKDELPECAPPSPFGRLAAALRSSRGPGGLTGPARRHHSARLFGKSRRTTPTTTAPGALALPLPSSPLLSLPLPSQSSLSSL